MCYHGSWVLAHYGSWLFRFSCIYTSKYIFSRLFAVRIFSSRGAMPFYPTAPHGTIFLKIIICFESDGTVSVDSHCYESRESVSGCFLRGLDFELQILTRSLSQQLWSSQIGTVFLCERIYCACSDSSKCQEQLICCCGLAPRRDTPIALHCV